MEAQEAEGAAQTELIHELIQKSRPEICGTNVEQAEADETPDVAPQETAPLDELRGDAAEAGEARAEPLEAQVYGGVIEEDETQLAAIRELMTRAGARGIWLTLGEIAEATQFAEASISAQLRHLRKPRHGGHRVEKRRRGRARAAAARKICDGRRGPVIWEYRVLPRAERLF